MTMSTGTSMQDVLNAYTSSVTNTYSQKSANTQTVSLLNTSGAGKTAQTTSEYGNVIGNPELSDAAKEYYEQLKEKYGNYNFVLVSDDQSATAMQHASEYATEDKTTVLIDVSRVEAMASDETVREKYETILDNAAVELDSLKNSLQASGADVKDYGIQVNSDGTLSFFAVLKKATEAQKERIETAREESREEKKAEEKKAEQEEKQERLQNGKEKKTEQAEKTELASDTAGKARGNDKVISASSIDELLQKISDYSQNLKMDSVQTEEERMVGQHIDFRG